MKYFLLFILTLGLGRVCGQARLPLIKATSKNVAINDGGVLDREAWTLSPNIKLDVFTAERTRKTKWVTFRTDIDSIRVKVKPGTRFNFVVLLNGKDSCYTQIASAIRPEMQQSRPAKTDTIPFTLTAYNAIAVKTIINNTDTLTFHFDTGSRNFRITKDAILNKTKLLAKQPGVSAGTAAPNYNNLAKVFKLQMGNTVWANPDISATTLTAHEMDGRFGWNLFEGRAIEINYDLQVLVIHSGPFKAPKGFSRAKLEVIHSFVTARGAFQIAGKPYPGNFLFDTGADQAAILDSAWANRQNFAKELPLIRSTTFSNPRGVKFEIRIVRSPAFTINGLTLTNIPTAVLGSSNPAGFEINNLGNDLLKRFNMILDFKHDVLYLKPNHLWKMKYREDS
ncbi:hypothetical protein [Mucilaginibacter sp.]|uniref:hypothetical protein n=1 Tax=Mucilaginibacter sp. TaxID=1882438 RepID=UPI003267B494